MAEKNFEYWHDQYVLPIINDGRWHHQLMVETKSLTLSNFFTKVDDCCFKLSQEFSELRGPAVAEKVYIRLTVLEHLCTPEQVLKLCETSEKLRNHIDFCNNKDMVWLADRICGHAINNPQPQPEPTQENTMASIEIKNITFINNTDVTTMTDEQLIDAIKRLENEATDLRGVVTASTKIKAKIAGLEETLAKVVAILDAR